MSSAPSKTNPTSDPKNASTPAQDTKATAALEEDDEFEDFPVEGMFPFFFSLTIL